MTEPRALACFVKLWLPMVCGLAFVSACSDSGGNAADDNVMMDATNYTVDLSEYQGDGAPLSIANETLLLPFALGPALQVLSEEDPGDLVIAYTRVGCDLGDPSPHLESFQLAVGDPVHLTRVVIEQIVADDLEMPGPERAELIAAGTCFSLREPGSTWSEQVKGRVTVDGTRVTVALDVDAENVEALAIFLPAYTKVSKIAYQVTGQ